jgi:hypothetical protein
MKRYRHSSKTETHPSSAASVVVVRSVPGAVATGLRQEPGVLAYPVAIAPGTDFISRHPSKALTALWPL